jgi:hypothetical protein
MVPMNPVGYHNGRQDLVGHLDQGMDKNEFLIALSESEKTDFGRIEFSQQTEEQQVFSAIWDLESEVNNGGFEQYFCNLGGDTANFVPTALERIGAH